MELIDEWTRCEAEGAALGYHFPAEECAQACVDDGTCMFFMYDPNDGECIAKYTESADCPEGLESSSYYYFYAIQFENSESSESVSFDDVTTDSESESEGTQVETDIVLISEGNECASEHI
jgi:hypothetical protein